MITYYFGQFAIIQVQNSKNRPDTLKLNIPILILAPIRMPVLETRTYSFVRTTQAYRVPEIFLFLYW